MCLTLGFAAEPQLEILQSAQIPFAGFLRKETGVTGFQAPSSVQVLLLRYFCHPEKQPLQRVTFSPVFIRAV